MLYTPEVGIRLELLTSDRYAEYGYTRKIIHGALSGDFGGEITLFEVSLSLGNSSFGGQAPTQFYRGFAGYLVSGFLLDENQNYEDLIIQYEDQFNEIFFFSPRKEKDLIEMDAASELVIDEHTFIKVQQDSTGADIRPDEIDTHFFSRTPEPYEQFKEQTSSLIEDLGLELYRRNYLKPQFKLHREGSSVRELFELENTWRSFWELLTDRSMYPVQMLVKVSYKTQKSDEIYYKNCSLLKNFYKPIKARSSVSVRIQQNLPIHFGHFGKLSEGLSCTQNSFLKWDELVNDPQYQPVKLGVKRVLKSRSGYASRSDYLILISEIETLLDLLGHNKTNLETLIQIHSTENWEDELRGILKEHLFEESLSCYLTSIRRVIAHPKSATKKVKYQNILDDQFLFQKVYAYLAGLFVKAVLAEITSLSEDVLEKYTKQFILQRGSWRPIVYT